MSIIPLLALCIVALAPGPQAPDEPAISIERSPSTVERITFNLKSRPADMPPLKGPEAALTQYHFDCAVNLKFDVTDRTELSDGRIRVTAAVKRLRVRLTLANRIYLPDNANTPLRAHEEGHRQINEQVYDESAEAAARELAEEVMARTWTAEGADEDSAGKAATDVAVLHLCNAYLERVAGRASRVGDIYDRITQHGKRPIQVARAIKLAFEQDARGGPTTRQSCITFTDRLQVAATNRHSAIGDPR
jgi:hypothetical protein